MAAPTISVVSQPGSKRVVLHVIAAAGDVVSVVRTVDGVEYPVRGATDVTMTTVDLILADYEVPQNVAYSYVAKSKAAGTTSASAPVQVAALDFGGDVIFDLSKPWDAMVINVESFPSQVFNVARDVVEVWDREDPVVVSGRRQLPAGTLNLITLTLQERTQFIDVIRSGNVLGFSQHKPAYGLDPVMYWSVGSVTESRPSPLAVEAARKWALEVQQVRQPSSATLTAQGTVTWQTLKDRGGIWSTMKQSWVKTAGF
ncbi:MAG: hypothetical protein ACO28P_01355 [Ilumatobacteraceae bacterium]